MRHGLAARRLPMAPTRMQLELISAVVPADGKMLPIGGSGDFGDLRFWRQLSDKPRLARLSPHGGPNTKRNRQSKIKRRAHLPSSVRACRLQRLSKHDDPDGPHLV